jgi:molecular chaperone GrpE
MSDQEEQKKDEKKQLTVEELQKELAECSASREEFLNGWKRAKADLINYKKEEGEHLAEIARYTRHNYIYSLLPMLDNMNLTAARMPPELLEDANVKGLLMVKTQMEDFLKANGVEAVKSVGEKFDPSLHEVIQAVEAEGKESGTVVEELSAGYTIDGNLLRPAKVKVAK